MPTAKERFEKLDSRRDQVLQRARDAADITIPALLPPEGNDENSNLPTPYQSLGARGINNLTSKIRLALFPPGIPFFKFTMSKAAKEEIGGADPKVGTKIDAGLLDIANEAMELLEMGNDGVILHAAIKQLVTTGNVLLHMPTEGESRTFRLPQYVVVRDPSGNWHEIIAKEMVHKTTISEAVKTQVSVSAPNNSNETDDEDIAVYTRILRVEDKAEWYQEINEIEVSGTRGKSAIDDCPYMPLRWSALDGEDYGRGHVEEYLGDLRSLEDLSKSLVAWAAAASKIIFLDHPSSTTDIKAIQNAQSGDFVEGHEDDIGILQVDKMADFKVTKSQVDDLSLRISHAFLLQSGTVRDAERVTKAEIMAVAQELEDVLGGVYSVLAKELQLPVVRRLVVRLKAKGRFPKLPAGTLTPTIITGFDALGRGHELVKFRAFFADGVEIFGDAFINEFDPSAVADVLATSHNIDIKAIKKSQEQKDKEAQQQIQANVMDAAKGAAAPLAQGAVENLSQQQ